MSGQSVVVLGAGVGGLVCANELRRRLPREHRVVLIERNPEHAFAPSFLWLMTGDRHPGDVTRPLSQLVDRAVELELAEATEIDLTGARVVTEAKSFDYDQLVIALGAELAPESIPGLNEAAQTFYTFEGATRLRDALQAFAGGTVAVVVGGMPYKCPGAPYEGAMLISDFIRRRGIGGKSEVHLFTPEPQPLPVAGPQLGSAVTEMLEKAGVALHPLHSLTAVDPATRELSFQDRATAKCDLLIAIPPHRGPALARESGLANEAGWIPADRGTLATQHEHVYALGDAAAIAIPGRWKPDVPLMLPKAGVFAHGQAKTVASRIAAEVGGEEPADVFSGDGYCILEAGGGVAGFAAGHFYAEPSPDVRMRQPGRLWHAGKVAFERWWLEPLGIRRSALHLALASAGRVMGTPLEP